MTQAEARQITDKIRTWPPEEQEWWRQLLATSPKEALAIGILAVRCDARPHPPL